MAVSPIPAGFHTATPQLIVRGAARALDFYREAFGADEVMRLTAPGGAIVHAEMRIGDSLVMVAEENPDWGNLSPEALGGSAVSVHLYVDDVDAAAERAMAAGARVLIPVADQFYGDRSGRLADPFGHLWVLATHREDVPHDEMQRRLDELMKGGA